VIPTFRATETVQVVAPLGLRFWDQVTNQPVVDGLSVVAYPTEQPNRRVEAVRTLSGMYAFADLPSLPSAVRFGAGDARYWDQLAVLHSHTLEVYDAAGRFLPWSFTADVPVRGVFSADCGPTGSPLSFPSGAIALYSAPGRPVPVGMAAVRAELWDIAQAAPAAWAVLSVSASGGVTGRGVADRMGRVLVILPYPEPGGFPHGSPLHGSGPPLTHQQWSVELEAHYTPTDPVPYSPELCRTLEDQQVAWLWSRVTPGQALDHDWLHFGEQLVLRTTDLATGRASSRLFITLSGSPP
jgi:hypothetical protein